MADDEQLQPEASSPEVADLFARVPEDPSARDELVARFSSLAAYLARRFSGRGEPLDDLIQVANLGLVKAIRQRRILEKYYEKNPEELRRRLKKAEQPPESGNPSDRTRVKERSEPESRPAPKKRKRKRRR